MLWIVQIQREARNGLEIRPWKGLYDHIDWDFFDFAFTSKSFSIRWRKWVPSCLFTTHFSIVGKGALSSFFLVWPSIGRSSLHDLSTISVDALGHLFFFHFISKEGISLITSRVVSWKRRTDRKLHWIDSIKNTRKSIIPFDPTGYKNKTSQSKMDTRRDFEYEY